MGGVSRPRAVAASCDARIAAPAGTHARAAASDGSAPSSDAVRTRSCEIDIGTRPGVYRVEATSAAARRRSVPWLLTQSDLRRAANASMRLRSRMACRARGDRIARLPPTEWAGGSRSELDQHVHRRRCCRRQDIRGKWRFALGGGARAGQFAALRLPVDGRRHVRSSTLRVRRGAADARVGATARRGGVRRRRAVGSRRSMPTRRSVTSLDVRSTSSTPLGAAAVAPAAARRDRLAALRRRYAQFAVATGNDAAPGSAPRWAAWLPAPRPGRNGQA